MIKLFNINCYETSILQGNLLFLKDFYLNIIDISTGKTINKSRIACKTFLPRKYGWVKVCSNDCIWDIYYLTDKREGGHPLGNTSVNVEFNSEGILFYTNSDGTLFTVPDQDFPFISSIRDFKIINDKIYILHWNGAIREINDKGAFSWGFAGIFLKSSGDYLLVKDINIIQIFNTNNLEERMEFKWKKKSKSFY